MATITNYPDRKTVAYAEVWSADEFRIERNPLWWPRDWALDAEEKGDELGIGAGWKLDIPAPLWLVWEGTADGVRVLQTQAAANEAELDNPPGDAFMPVYPDVNQIRFEAKPGPEPEPDPEPQPPGEEPGPEPEEPAPEPGPPAFDRVPRTITIYGGGMSRLVFTWWGDHFVATVPREQFMAVWEMLVERIGAWFDR